MIYIIKHADDNSDFYIDFVVDGPAKLNMTQIECDFRSRVMPFQTQRFDTYNKHTWTAEQFKKYLIKNYECKECTKEEYVMCFDKCEATVQ